MFDLPLSLVQLLPRLPGLCALAGRTDYPFLGCSSKWIWGQSIYALSWKATLILPSHMFCRLLITLCDSEIYQWSSPPCFSTVNFRAEKKKNTRFCLLIQGDAVFWNVVFGNHSYCRVVQRSRVTNDLWGKAMEECPISVLLRKFPFMLGQLQWLPSCFLVCNQQNNSSLSGALSTVAEILW